ncbi:MAG TPA: lipid-A-disaccharide synthase [Methylomirabilota bacterium]|nr:lipid-A-disaccharide synthase [Methylomirabilota bacterium]
MRPAEGLRPTTIMLSAGEASGDGHGALLCRALRSQAPELTLLGLGGARMAAEGVDLVADVTRRAAVGTTEALGRIPALWRTFRVLRDRLERERPAVLVLIDFPEFNLRLARAAHRAGVPVVYFVPPQIWAWRAWRVRAIRRWVSLVLAALPFEPAIYRRAGVPVEFVGHPVLDALGHAPSRAEARERLGVPSGALLIGLLPGSRAEEVGRMAPLMREAARRIAAAHPEATFALGLASTVGAGPVRGALAGGPPVRIVADDSHAVIRAADLLLATSGTVTLEAALLGTPLIVCYRVSAATELLGRVLLRVPWIGLTNLTLGREAVPELYERRHATPERLASAALRLLDTPGELDAQRAAFVELRSLCGEPGVGARAARHVLSIGGVFDGSLRGLPQHASRGQSPRSNVARS